MAAPTRPRPSFVIPAECTVTEVVHNADGTKTHFATTTIPLTAVPPKYLDELKARLRYEKEANRQLIVDAISQAAAAAGPNVTPTEGTPGIVRVARGGDT
jgi:hypothetical protein